MDAPISHEDVTNIMRMVGDIQVDVHVIRRLLEEDDDGEEEEDPEADG